MITQADMDALNTVFEKSAPADVVKWACAEFGNDLVMSSSFGADSAALIHMAIGAKADIRIIMVDTGYLFPETWEFMEELRERFKLHVWIYRTRQDPIAYLKKAGEENPQYRNDIEACCAVNKNEPFDRAMGQMAPKAWLRGIRRRQSDARQDRQFVEFSPRYNCWAISPLLNWGGREVHAYLQEHGLPYHPLRDEGYLSIGCNPLSCTRAIMPGDDERSGRWAGTGKVECGINLDSLDSAKL